MTHSLSPTKVDLDGVDSKALQDSGGAKNSISVHSSGEVTSLPDIIEFTVTILSSKDTVEDAQASVKRRVDYITQVIRKNGVKNNNVTVCTEINRESVSPVGGSLAEKATVSTDVAVKCDNLSKCETIRNVLIEKMDTSVQFSPVSFWHSTEAKETGRQEAFKRAVVSAKAKAECISQTVGVQLGSALQVKEVTQDSQNSQESVSLEPDANTRSPGISLHQRHVDAAITFTSQVYTCFETQLLRLCTHKKCSKHTK